MASIDLVVRQFEKSSQPDCIVPFIDGRDLVEMVTEFEQSQGHESASGYDGIIPTRFNYGPLLAYFLGARERRYWGKIGKIAVLGCSCGEVGCGPLYTRVHVSTAHVSWSAFEQPHRKDRSYAGFGPFTFDRRQYEAAAVNVGAVFDRPAR